MATVSVTAPVSQAYLTWFASLNSAAHQRVTLIAVPSPELMVQMPSLVKAAAALRQMACLNLPIRDKSLNEIKEILENSFLGNYFLYCIWDLEQFPKNAVTALASYLAQYTGPHYIVLISVVGSPFSSAFARQTIAFPAALSPQQFTRFCTLWHTAPAVLQQSIALYTENNQVVLNQFAVALPYIPVLGKSLLPAFKKTYMPRLMKLDSGSLFAFTDLFWQKNPALFYKQWILLKELYADHFWITFWSEQFFRAYAFTYCMEQHESQAAQQIATRKLSFVYSKKSWHTVDSALIRTLHCKLYTIDYNAKNGGTVAMIEHIYATWFAQ